MIDKGDEHLPLLNRLKEYRSRLGVNQTEMGKLAGVSRQTISQIERGDYSPSVTLALKLAKEKNADIVLATDPDADRLGVRVKDKTGAGDAFCAGVASGLTYGKTLSEAVEIGSRLAASVITSSENVCPRFLPEEFGITLD